MHTTIITNEGGSQKGCNYRRDVWGGLAGDFLEMPCVPHSSPVSAVQLPDSRAPTGNRDKVGQKAVPKSGPFSDPKTGTAQGNLTGLGTGFRAPKNQGNPARSDHSLARLRPFVSNSPLRRRRRGYSSKSLKELGRHCGSAQSWKQLIALSSSEPRRTKQMREHQ